MLLLVGCGSSASAHFTVKSRLVGRSLEQAVILPSGNTKGRPLLVLLHGRSSQPDDMARSSVKKAVDKLGPRAPVVLFANGGNHSYYHDRCDGRWGSYILREAIPATVRKYHLDGRRVAIGGFSMGGFGALDLARFRRFCAVGGHEDFEQNDLIAAARANPHLYRGARVWIDVGTEDPFRSADTELAGLLPQARFRLWHGGHEISYLDHHATEILRFYANTLRDC